LEANMGRRLAAQRLLLGLSQEALAGRTGLPLLRLQAYEAGLRRILPPDLLRLCDALGIGPAHFLDGLPPRSPE
jgi:transcriptional regulator with XRE-family HTH domain